MEEIFFVVEKHLSASTRKRWKVLPPALICGAVVLLPESRRKRRKDLVPGVFIEVAAR